MPAGLACLTTDRREWTVARRVSIDLPGLRRESQRRRRACTAPIRESSVAPDPPQKTVAVDSPGRGIHAAGNLRRDRPCREDAESLITYH